MKVFLAGTESICPANISEIKNGYNLISFASINKMTPDIISSSKMFLLDSGAFTFMRNSHDKKINWDEYIEKYAEFINQNNVEYFFELDIDNIVGYKEVLRLRTKLEYLTQKKCIPVWHKSRGLDEFCKMCEEYDYVAIGGIVTREIKKSDFYILPFLIKEAHKRRAKIHGLGFTSTKILKEMHFDSVDSTNWSYGKYGHYWEFTKDKNMKMHTRIINKQVLDRVGLQKYNIQEWIKFQKYAENNL